MAMTRNPDNRKNPYVGPPAFKYGQTLYGRDREVHELLDLLIVERIVTLYSPSGAGKSSLINAALRPALEKKRFNVLPVIRVGKEFRSDDPNVQKANRYVLSSLISLSTKNGGEKLVPVHELARMTLPKYLEQLPKETGTGANRVLIFDQFEEILTADSTDQFEKQEFFTQIGSVLRNYEYWVLFSMREEHFAGLQPYLHLVPTGLSTTYRLELLGPKDAEKSIRKPAEDAGVTFRKSAARKLVDDLRSVKVRHADGFTDDRLGPYVEPLQLQVVCESLWEAIPPGADTITTEDLNELGDVNQALLNYYEQALKETTEATGVKINDLRRWFDEYLITPGGTRGMAHRDEEYTGRGGRGIPNAAVDELEKHHIIRAEIRAGGERWYELTHDRFIGPVNEANEDWREYTRRKGWMRKIYAAIAVLGTLISLIVGLAFRERLEFSRTTGQVNALIERSESDFESAMEGAPTVLDNVAGYLWQKKTTPLDQLTAFVFRKKNISNIDKLAKILQSADKLISENYGIDPWVLEVMPSIKQIDRWPITVSVDPHRKLNDKMIQYQWRSLIPSFVREWGILVPNALQIEWDKYLLDEIKISIPDAYEKPDKSKPSKVSITIPSIPDSVLVSRKDMRPELIPWFEQNKDGWQEVIALKYNGPWWLVSKWTTPLFKVAAHNSFPQEAAVALAVGNQLLAQPELVLNRQNVAYLLNKLKETGFSITVDETLAARGGIETIVGDLREVVRQDYPLSRLRHLLDALATFPAPDFSSSEAASLSIEWQYRANGPVQTTLSGPWKVTRREGAKYELKPTAESLYRDSAAWLDYKRPIRVYIGKALINEFMADDKLLPAILESIADLHGEAFKRFGITPPPVIFREARSDLAPEELRIEILNQSSSDEDAQPFSIGNIEATRETLLKELRWRCLLFRSWWINNKEINQHLKVLPDKLENWLRNHYSLTDIKSLLRLVIATSQKELDAYNASGLSAALDAVSPGQSLREFRWLMASLPFWIHVSDRYDAQTLAENLQTLQKNRLAANLSNYAKDSVSEDIGKGLAALDNQDLSLAEQHFKKAASTNKNSAIKSFLDLYTRQPQVTFEGQLAKLKSDCKTAPPGKLREESSVSLQTRYSIEDFLHQHREQIEPADQRALELCLLEHYAVNNYRQHTRDFIERFLADDARVSLGPNEKYFLAYRLLEFYGAVMRAPDEFPRIEELLLRAFKEWTEVRIAESAFYELSKRYGDRLPPPWYLDLLEKIAGLYHGSFWIALDIGTVLSGGRSVKDAEKAVIWLDKARQWMPNSNNPEADWPRLLAFQQYTTASAYLTQAELGRHEDRAKRADQAIRLLRELIDRLRYSGSLKHRKWPGKNAYALLIDAYRQVNKIPEARRTLDEALSVFGGADIFIEGEFAFYLNAGDVDKAVRLAQRALNNQNINATNAMFWVAISQLLTDHIDAPYAARRFLDTDHPYTDYIRMMLYWRLSRDEKNDQAKALMIKRWGRIDPDTWQERLDGGDPTVWREMLVGYYLDEVEQKTLFGPLESRDAFEASSMSRLGVEGLSYDGMLSEIYFYDALLQGISGDSSTRSQRFESRLREVIKVGNASFYEYLMAQYLLDQIAGGG
jgi:hypothetical protein